MKTAQKNAPVKNSAAPEPVSVAIIGAGISGIGVAKRLLDEGITDFVILEKAASVGGTWRDNTYPGCACDVPSALYSYSFAQKPDWSRVFAGQAEILDYVADVAGQYDLKHYLRFSTPVNESRWDDRAGHWIVETSNGVFHAKVLVSCTGYLHEPIVPNIPGLKEFPGKLFHSARWDHAHALDGERVAVIGTGASAIQFVPKIQPKVKSLAIFQRTPQWILPKADGTMPTLSQRLLSLPFATEFLRRFIYNGLEVFGIGFRRPEVMKVYERLARANLEYAVKDPVLRAKLTPDYVLGCKRVLMSNDYYPAVSQPNVEMFAEGVKAVRGNTVIGSDGSEREVDTIILGTGFHVSEQPNAAHVYGKAGKSLADLWQGSPQAYRGTTISGFPNFFLVLGPNLAIGNNSAFIVIEAQVGYIMRALRTMNRERLSRIDVRESAQQAWNERVQKDLAHTVWNTGGCASYYIDANGRNSIGFPWSTQTMKRVLADFDIKDYEVTAADTPVPGWGKLVPA